MKEDRLQRTLDVPFQRLKKIEHEPATRKIVRESVKILVLCSIISSFGGFGLEAERAKLVVILPLLILLPALNDMIGDLGSIVASKFTTLLFLRKVQRRSWWKSPLLHALFMNVCGVAVISAVFMSVLAYGIAFAKGFPFSWLLFAQIVSLAVLATGLLVSVLFVVCVVGGLYVHKKGHDPENYLIPLATAIGDLGSMALLAVALAWVF